MTRTRKSSVLVAAALAALVLLSGCSASNESSGGSAVQYDTADSAEAVTESDADSAVIITGEISLVADDPIAAAEKATGIVTAAGGRVDAREEYVAQAEGDSSSATLTVRVPAEAVDDVRSDLAGIATIDRTSLHTEEVGATQRDLEARAESLRTSVARYNQWLAAAAKPADLMELEEGLAERQTNLERLESEIAGLADRVAMSTFTLTFSSAALGVPVDSNPKNFGEALGAGWSSLVNFLGAFLIGIGVMLPWLALLGALTWLVFWIVRVIKRRSVKPQVKAGLQDKALP